ncbi:hypothetical protein Tco_1295382 [Tanacetum coccineum]
MEKGFLTAKGRWSGKGVKEKHSSVGDVRDTVLCYADSGPVTSTVKAMVKSSSDTLSNNNGNVNTSIVNMETPLELNKGDDVTSNANVEPTTSASLLVFVSFTTLLKGDMSKKVSSYARAMIELQADAELKYTIIVVMPKIIGKGFYMCTIRVEYEWKPPRCSSCKIIAYSLKFLRKILTFVHIIIVRVFGHVLNECPKKIFSDVAKNLNNPRQACRGVPVGPNVSFKSSKQIYKHVSNKNGASTNGKKKQVEVSR